MSRVFDLEKVKAGYMRLQGCIEAEHCEYIDCIYFANPDELAETLDFLNEAINEATWEQLQDPPPGSSADGSGR